ncbi:DUF4198 domain-containing protein [Desulfovibrio sp. ZJ200]|uniref:DUF4198 domain-containing protein n=1 Tax=Desulfovibrio sp. ZJ200 TaxID=2709792 RepID=UPI0013EBDFD9|nr:DUF4198 domain-containing protein [Desulfovibrio sp. ZJ200]
MSRACFSRFRLFLRHIAHEPVGRAPTRQTGTAALLLALCCLLPAPGVRAQVTLLVPSQPGIEAPARTERPNPSAKAREEQKKQASEQNPARAVLPTPARPAAEPARDRGQKKQDAQTENAAAVPLRPATPPAPGTIDKNATSPAPGAAQQPAERPGQPAIAEEVDVLITMMRPFQHQGLSMDMPQLFSVLRYDDATPAKDGVLQPERRDLLGDVEEIRYLDQKAWGANVALTSPGLYQFIIEARPWWDAARDRFVQHYVKTTLPVYGVERGWNLPVGQHFEIQPFTRPFGLTAPALFSGRALLNGQPLPGTSVRMARINTDKSNAPTPWHEQLEARTDSAGQFSFVLNQAGWWCCMAVAPGDPLRGPDGQAKPLELGALFWLYVDSPAAETGKR